MKILTLDQKKRTRTYKLRKKFDGSRPLREFIILVLANCRLRKPFRLVFEEDEVIKIKQLMTCFFQEPFSRYGKSGTINNFFEFWLLADFRASTATPPFSAVPLIKGSGDNITILAEITINCHGWEAMISHAKYLIFNRPGVTQKEQDALYRYCLKG
jgi:hypothetical protein